MSNFDNAASAPEISLAVGEILAAITGVEEVKFAPHLKIRELGILDSLGTVSLLISLSDRFGITISPSEIDEESFGTPNQVAFMVQEKLNA